MSMRIKPVQISLKIWMKMHHKLQQHIPVQPAEACNFTALARHSNQFYVKKSFRINRYKLLNGSLLFSGCSCSVRWPVVPLPWALKVSDQPVFSPHFLSSWIYSVCPPGDGWTRNFTARPTVFVDSFPRGDTFVFCLSYPRARLLRGATCLSHPRSWAGTRYRIDPGCQCCRKYLKPNVGRGLNFCWWSKIIDFIRIKSIYIVFLQLLQ